VVATPPPPIPPPPVVEKPQPKPPPPERKVVVKRPPPPREQVREPERELPPRPTPQQTASLPPVTAPAPMPRAPVAPIITPDYRSMLVAWFANHPPPYPEGARERGEEGRAMLSVRVARSGQVLSYALVGSSGFADLDAEVSRMMSGAVLPAFPPGMMSQEVQMTVPIHFRLAQ
jgi:periplasmic protein TonB